MEILVEIAHVYLLRYYCVQCKSMTLNYEQDQCSKIKIEALLTFLLATLLWYCAFSCRSCWEIFSRSSSRLLSFSSCWNSRSSNCFVSASRVSASYSVQTHRQRQTRTSVTGSESSIRQAAPVMLLREQAQEHRILQLRSTAAAHKA